MEPITTTADLDKPLGWDKQAAAIYVMKGRAEALSLYRSLLRAHANHLPPQMRQLGDAYVKSEFRAHKDVTKPEVLSSFFSEWQSYLDRLISTARARKAMSLDNTGIQQQDQKGAFEFGENLSQDVELSDDQMAQLEKLREEATKAGRSGS